MNAIALQALKDVLADAEMHVTGDQTFVDRTRQTLVEAEKQLEASMARRDGIRAAIDEAP